MARLGGSSLPRRSRGLRNKVGSWTCKPNFVCREAPPCGDHVPQDGHSSGLLITEQLKRPTRRFLRAEPAPVPPLLPVLLKTQQNQPQRRDSLPIWSCSVWGLPCPLHYCRGGALLPHLFTLTQPFFWDFLKLLKSQKNGWAVYFLWR